MPTVVSVSIIPGGGGDYSSLTAAESGEQRDLPAADEISQWRCHSGQITDDVGIAGWTTDATRYIEILPETGHEHGGLPTAGFRVTNSVSAATIRVGGHNAKIRGIVMLPTSTSAGAGGVLATTGANDVEVDSCLVFGPGGTSRAIGVEAEVAGDVVRVYNCIFAYMNTSPGGFGIQCSVASATIHAYNNTAIDCRFGYVRSNGTFRPKNNIAQNPGTGAGYSGTFTDTATNISSDATSPQTGLRNITLTFVDAANDDFHLDATDTEAIGAGTDLSADATIAFDYDIDGDTRPASNWDIGADQTAAAGANELSGTPSAQATDASGTMDAVASGSGTPQAGAATSTGELDTIDRASGTPQAGAATSTGVLDAVASGVGAPQAGAATGSGEAQAVASASGTAQAGSPTSAGTLMVVVSMSGAPQAGLADGFGTADDGQAPLITPKRKGMITDVGEVLRP